MKEYWYWIELIGFDKEKPDFGIENFLEASGKRATGISLLLSCVDFVNTYKGMDNEYYLGKGVASYYGHPFNDERAIQKWTNYDLKRLVKQLQDKNLKVVFSFFNMYHYLDENEKLIFGDYIRQHFEICEYDCKGERQEGGVNPIKRFSDGSFYEDFLISQSEKILNDYGFDGIMLADGMSSNRQTIQNGDYTDDLVEQFLAFSKEKLPENIKLKCFDDKEEYVKRYKYIFENKLSEWLDFVSNRYKTFYNKYVEAVSNAGKLFIFNSTWTRDPFEALYRYGIDYKLINDKRIYAIMVEDCGGLAPIYSNLEQSLYEIPFEHRRYYNYEYMLTQMSLKAYMPELNQISMTTVKDVMEQWNLVDNAYTEFNKMVVRRSTSFVYENGKYVLSSHTPLYCLADGIPKHTWDKINKIEELSDWGNSAEPIGFTAVFNDNIKKEVDNYIKDKRYSQTKILNELLISGLKINCMTTFKELDNVSAPLIVCNIENYKDTEIEYLENYTKNPLFVFSYNNVLNRKCSQIISYNEKGLKCFCYNVSLKENINLNIAVKDTEISYYQNNRAIWTNRLIYKEVPKDFFKTCCLECDKFFDFPKIIFDEYFEFPGFINNTECKLFIYKITNNNYRIIVSNDDYYVSNPNIKFLRKVLKVKSLTKPDWYNVPHDDFTVCPRVANRGVEILDINLDKSINII